MTGQGSGRVFASGGIACWINNTTLSPPQLVGSSQPLSIPSNADPFHPHFVPWNSNLEGQGLCLTWLGSTCALYPIVPAAKTVPCSVLSCAFTPCTGHALVTLTWVSPTSSALYSVPFNVGFSAATRILFTYSVQTTIDFH